MRLHRRNRDPALHSIYDSEFTPAQKLTALIGLLILTGCTSSTSSSVSASNSATPSASSSPHESASPRGQRWETQEFGANAFEQVVNGQTVAGAKVFIRIGEQVLAVCHIPPDGTEDESLRKGGLYIVHSPVASKDGLIKVGQNVVTAANTFVNQGPTSAYDQRVAECNPQQEASIGYVRDGAFGGLNNPTNITAVVTGPRQASQ